jgi:coenzyme PQQ precursor peptide PqqA
LRLISASHTFFWCTRLAALLAGDDKTGLFERNNPMTWTTPTLVEICVGLEINGYLPAEF